MEPERESRVIKSYRLHMESKPNTFKRLMGEYGWVLVLIGWFVLMKFVFPRFGVST